jgi:DNA topoisomerase-1
MRSKIGMNAFQPGNSTTVPRLRRSACSAHGLARRRCGGGFSFRMPDGTTVGPAERDRLLSLAIPPAWQDVWICPWPNGHIQATGTDTAGRRQYLYHEAWHRQRSRIKFDRVLEFGHRLPQLRRAVNDHLALDGMPQERALALAVRLLDVGAFRIGSEVYAERNDTFGVATLLRDHVRLCSGMLQFAYTAKGGIPRELVVDDPLCVETVRTLKKRRGGGQELLAFKESRLWNTVRSDDVNRYIKEWIGADMSAKDFRTWAATVRAAEELARYPVTDSVKGRRSAKSNAVAVVADMLGNTPSVSRASYIDPRLFDRFDHGETIVLIDDGPRPPEIGSPRSRRLHEEAVLRLLEGQN